MSMRVFAWESNPAIDRFKYRQSNDRAKELVSDGEGFFVTLPDGRRAVQLYPPQEVLLERSARNNLLPFGRVLNKLMHPPSINYPIPAAADRSLAWKLSFMTPEKKGPAPALNA